MKDAVENTNGRGGKPVTRVKSMNPVRIFSHVLVYELPIVVLY